MKSNYGYGKGHNKRAEKACHDYFEMFGVSGNDIGEFKALDRCAVGTELFFGWIKMMMWREKMKEEVCVSPCHAPIIMTTGKVIELVLTILGIPGPCQPPLIKALTDSVYEVIEEKADGWEDDDAIHTFAVNALKAIWETGIGLRKSRGSKETKESIEGSIYENN